VILSLQDRQQGSIVAGIMPRMRGLRLVGEKKRQESHEILRQFRISHLADRPAGEISYGEQKLLSIACCIGLAPRLLLIDEPVAGINPELRLQMAQLLKDLRGSGYTIVLIEHNTDFIESISDRFIFANEGRAVEYSSFKVMIQDPTVLESYLV
jgi:ABC-type branched-subunit amino acid transport system ATPase component